MTTTTQTPPTPVATERTAADTKAIIRRRFPLFDSLRAVAALMVLVFHVGLASDIIGTQQWGRWIGQLNAGVAVFFVISGFLLYRPYIASRLTGSTLPGARGYAKRRALRILPGYWFALTLLAIIPGLVGVFSSDWWRFYGFLQVYDPATQFEGLRPAWSLCVEISFYALLPVYAVLLTRALRRRRIGTQVRVELALLAAFWLSAYVLRQIFAGKLGIMEPHDNLLFTLPSTLDWFALGMALAVVSAAVDVTGYRHRLLDLVARRPLLVWGMAFALFAITSVPRSDPFNVHHVAAGILGLLLVLPAVFGEGTQGAPRRILASAPVAWMGVISYGIFLWHEPFTDYFWDNGIDSLGSGVAGFLVLLLPTLAVGLVMGAVSFYLVEQPFMRLGSRRRAKTPTPAHVPSPTPAATPAVASVALEASDAGGRAG